MKIVSPDRCPKGPHACEDPSWHDDWSSPEFVLGAVLAQLEDLSRDEKLSVLSQAFILMEGTVWDHDGDPSVSFRAGRWVRVGDREGAHEK
jgi:hypothetical protein